MKIEVSVKDRLTIIALLPSSGKMTDLVEVIDLVKLIKFTEEEKAEMDYKEVNGRITWNPAKEITKEIEINFEQLRIIKEQIKKLDKEEKIDLSTLDTCLRFSKL